MNFISKNTGLGLGQAAQRSMIQLLHPVTLKSVPQIHWIPSSLLHLHHIFVSQHHTMVRVKICCPQDHQTDILMGMASRARVTAIVMVGLFRTIILHHQLKCAPTQPMDVRKPATSEPCPKRTTHRSGAKPMILGRSSRNDSSLK